MATTFADPEVLAGVLTGSDHVITRPIALYARASPEHPALAAALRPILKDQLPVLCQRAVDQAATETNRELTLGDSTLAAALSRWTRVSAIETAPLREAVGPPPPRSDLVLNPLAVALTAELVESLRRLAAANPAASDLAAPTAGYVLLRAIVGPLAMK